MTRNGTNSNGRTGRAIAYLRVSTDKQADSGLGLDAQRRAIEQAAGRLQLTIAQTYADEGLSGALAANDRPGLADALNELRRGDVLLVAKRDRIARDAILAAIIDRGAHRKGARIISVAGEGTETDDPTAIFTRRILD